jgi:hypothetical protein
VSGPLPAEDVDTFERVALLADGLHPQRTPYDVDEAAATIRATGYPHAEQYVETLRHPPGPDVIIADAEGKEFSD